MYFSETKIRVRYSETDKMGYVYYGNYAQYYEIGRAELMRKMGFPYRKLEDQGIFLPIVSLKVKYIKPALYDDMLTIKTYLKEKPAAKIKFDYEIYNEQGELINKGDTTLVFVDYKTKKPRKAPREFLNLFNKS